MKTRGLTPILQPLLLSIGGVNQNRAAQKGTNRSRSIGELEYYVLIIDTLSFSYFQRVLISHILHSILVLHCRPIEVACRDRARGERDLHGLFSELTINAPLTDHP